MRSRGGKPTAATSPTARPRRWASIFSAIDCCCGGWARARPACSATSLRPASIPAASSRCSAGALRAGRRGRQHSDRRSPHAAHHWLDRRQGRSKRSSATYRWSAEVAPQFIDDEHYEYDHDDKKVELTARAARWSASCRKPAALDDDGARRSVPIHRAGHQVRARLSLDRQYVVKPGDGRRDRHRR